MKDHKSLLVIFDTDNEEQPALSRAIQMYHDVEDKISKIIVLSNIYHDALGKSSVIEHDLRISLKETCLSKHYTDLEQQVKDFQLHHKLESSTPIETIVTWHSNIIHAISEVYNQHPDLSLALKSSQHHNLLEKYFFTPIEWHIIRKSPIPIMLVKTDKPWQYKNQLVALDSTALEPQHQQLNTKLMEFSQELEEQLSLDTHIVNAFPTLSDLAIGGFNEIPTDIDTDIENAHVEATKKYAKDYNIEKDHIHVWVGDTEHVIEEAAQKCHADLILIGTIGREGLSNFLVGNTSEKVINHINSDVVVLHLEENQLQ